MRFERKSTYLDTPDDWDAYLARMREEDDASSDGASQELPIQEEPGILDT